MVNEAGEVVETVVESASDIDVIRSKNFTSMRKNRDKIAGEAHKRTGFKMKFQVVQLGQGFSAYLPEEISITPELRFQDPMPVKETENQMYGTAERIVLGVGDMFLKGFLGWLLNDAHSDSVSAARPQYNGPYSNDYYSQSFNPVTTTETSFAPPLL